MNSNFIPGGDAPFNVWQGVLVVGLTARATKLGIPAEEMARVLASQDRWNKGFEAASNPATRTKGAIREKQEAREDFEAELRKVIKAYITYNPAVTDQERDDMGLPVHDSKPSPAPAIGSRPELEVHFPQIQQHSLTVRDSELDGRAMPAHAVGFEVWRKVGDPAPAQESDWLLVVQAPHSPCLLTYGEQESGVRIYYRVRWVNTRGVPGPWSETVSAVVP
jgi:hypothetical protein